MSGLFKFFSVFPLWLAHLLGWMLGWLVFGLSGKYRRRFLENARQAGLKTRQWLGAVGAAGQQIAELPRLWFGPPAQLEWVGTDYIEAAQAAGRGIMLLTPHLGCFEVTAQAYAERFGQGRCPITVLFRPPRKAWLTELVTTARQRPGLNTAPTSFAGIKQMIKALRNNECVGLLPDQVPPAGQGVWSPFFGRQAYTMTLAVRLALQTGSTVLLIWGERLHWGRGYRIHLQTAFAPGEKLAQDLEGAVAQINNCMERMIRSCPHQYLWSYARYKAPRIET